MEFLFTTTDSWESKLIRWGLGVDCSHFAIRFGDIVFHSYEGRIREDSYYDFSRQVRIVHTIKIPLSRSEEVISAITILQIMRTALTGKKYDFTAIYYWAWRGLLKKLTGRPIPRHNLWGKKNKFYCCEIVIPIIPELQKITGLKLNNIDWEMKSPHDMYEIFKQKEDNK